MPMKLSGATSRDRHGGSLRTRLIRGGIGVTAIGLAEVVLGLAAAILLARKLGAEGLGYYSVVFAATGLAALVVQLGLPMLVMREISSAGARNAPGEVRGMIRFGFAAMAAASLALCGPGLALFAAAGDAVPAGVAEGLRLGWILIPITAVTNYCAGILMGYHRVALARLPGGLLRPLLFLALVLAPEWTTGGPLTPAGAILFQVAAAGAGLMLALGLLLLSPMPGGGARPVYRVRAWLADGLLLGVNNGLRLFQPQILILMMPLFANIEAAGLLRMAQRAAALADFGSGAVILTIGPHIASLHASGEKAALQRLVTIAARLMTGVLLAGSAVFALAGNWLILTILGPEFTAAYWPTLILMAGLTINAYLGPNAMLLQMAGAVREVTAAATIAIVVCTATALVLIPSLGASGAAFAALAAAVCRAGFLYFRVRLRLGIRSGALGL